MKKYFRRTIASNIHPKRDKSVLVFPKGTIVKFDGIPCELTQDTPYESEHFRRAREGK